MLIKYRKLTTSLVDDYIEDEENPLGQREFKAAVLLCVWMDAYTDRDIFPRQDKLKQSHWTTNLC